MPQDFVSAGAATDEAVTTLQSNIDALETQITTVLNQGNTLANDSGWAGIDADGFREQWEGGVRSGLQTTLEKLREIQVGAGSSSRAIQDAGSTGGFG
jgi:hypothetical protein